MIDIHEKISYLECNSSSADTDGSDEKKVQNFEF